MSGETQNLSDVLRRALEIHVDFLRRSAHSNIRQADALELVLRDWHEEDLPMQHGGPRSLQPRGGSA
jgi:hypothetical protein